MKRADKCLTHRGLRNVAEQESLEAARPQDDGRRRATPHGHRGLVPTPAAAAVRMRIWHRASDAHDRDVESREAFGRLLAHAREQPPCLLRQDATNAKSRALRVLTTNPTARRPLAPLRPELEPAGAS